MAEFTAKDVKALRDATGAGMMDAKRALSENDGDMDAATTWLRERGLGKAAERAGREATQGGIAVAVTPDGRAGALVELTSETDFGAKTPPFVSALAHLAEAVAEAGEGAVDAKRDALDHLRLATRENIQVGRVARFEVAEGNILETYVHVQNGRGVNGVMVELAGGTVSLAHDIAVHVAFGKPGYLARGEVPAEAVAAERVVLENETRNEGKPEAAVAKIVEGRLNGWFKRMPGGVLLEQPYAKDDKQTVAQVLGSASIVRFAQAVIDS